MRWRAHAAERSTQLPHAKDFESVCVRTTKNFEKVQIEDGIEVSLETPTCDLKWPHCKGEAVAAIRVHGCAFHFACAACKGQLQCRVVNNFKRFSSIRCQRCGLGFTHENYYTIFPLQEWQ